MFTIGQIAKQFSISRSTLLYYDSIGLLTPSERSDSNYRLYSDNDVKKMEKIALFRDAGLSLESIACLLDKTGDDLHSALEQRLISINEEIQGLRHQQQIVIQLLKNENSIKRSRVITKKIWIAMLEAAGLNESGMKKWHIAFEQTSPEAHQDFLESIGIEANEIKIIREWSRSNVY